MNEILPRESGVYIIESISKPERVYVGSAVNIYKRRQYHLEALHKNKHHSHKLQRHCNKYGDIDLIFRVVQLCDKESLLILEQHFINTYNPYFNECKIAGSCLGRKHSAETCEKISNSNKGQVPWIKGVGHSEETKRKIGEANKGKKQSVEQREASRQRAMGNNYHTGHPQPESAKAKISETHKGKKIPPDVILKIKEKLIGHEVSDETREKLRVALTGRVFSDISKKRMSESRKGKTPWKGRRHSKESRAKMSQSAKRRWANKKKGNK